MRSENLTVGVSKKIILCGLTLRSNFNFRKLPLSIFQSSQHFSGTIVSSYIMILWDKTIRFPKLIYTKRLMKQLSKTYTCDALKRSGHRFKSIIHTLYIYYVTNENVKHFIKCHFMHELTLYFEYCISMFIKNTPDIYSTATEYIFQHLCSLPQNTA